MYQVIRPSIVYIETKGKGSQGEEGVGTGVVVNDKGDILTSLHVVTNSTNIQVTFADGTQSAATVSSQQPEIDIAVLKAETLPAQVVPAVMGNPNAMRIGDEAYAVGNPFGLYSSMSAGVISGFNRTFESPENNQKLTGLIQIDTAVNPGNSGGPLLNSSGQVSGINSQIESVSGGNDGPDIRPKFDQPLRQVTANKAAGSGYQHAFTGPVQAANLPSRASSCAC